MSTKKILLIEPDKVQAGIFTGWLSGESYNVKSIEDLREAQSFLINEKFDIILIDIDPSPVSVPAFSEADIRMLKTGARFKGLPVVVLTNRKDIKNIIAIIESGVDIFMLKPLEIDSFLERVKNVFKNIELRSGGKKTVDLNYVNYLIDLAGQMEHEDFFALSPVIFNSVIIEKINTILGPLIITQIIKRVNELVGTDYEFMKSVEFLNKGLSLEGVDKVSKEVPVKKIALAYRDYVLMFLRLVSSLTSDILTGAGGGQVK
ncbi:MAG: response regulator [bacterium]|nr:response regulator [bacterium]